MRAARNQVSCDAAKRDWQIIKALQDRIRQRNSVQDEFDLLPRIETSRKPGSRGAIRTRANSDTLGCLACAGRRDPRTQWNRAGPHPSQYFSLARGPPVGAYRWRTPHQLSHPYCLQHNRGKAPSSHARACLYLARIEFATQPKLDKLESVPVAARRSLPDVFWPLCQNSRTDDFTCRCAIVSSMRTKVYAALDGHIFFARNIFSRWKRGLSPRHPSSAMPHTCLPSPGTWTISLLGIRKSPRLIFEVIRKTSRTAGIRRAHRTRNKSYSVAQRHQGIPG